MPKEVLSQSGEHWLNQSDMDPQEPALGLRWLCQSDTLMYKSYTPKSSPITMRNIYRMITSLYDPLGYITPFSTRAKIIVQPLWNKKREWDDPLLPGDLLEAWKIWKRELQHLNDTSPVLREC